MIYKFTEYELFDFFAKAVELGAKKIVDEMGLRKKQISQLQAYKQFGETNVKRWRKDRKIIPVKIGRIIYYDVAKLETLAASNYLVHKYIRHERDGQNAD